MQTGFTREQFEDAVKEADRRMKESNGHTYMAILKTRCMFCGASPNRKTRCRLWLNTFMDRLGHVLEERGVIADNSKLETRNSKLP